MPAWIAARCLDTSRQRPSAIVAMISANLIAQSAADVWHIEINPKSDRLLESKQLQLLHEVIPNAARFGVLVDPGFTGTPSLVANLQGAARTLGLQLVVANARTD